MRPELYIGLMSGTSIDSIDAALVDFSSSGTRLIATHEEPIDPQFRRDILALCTPGPGEIERMGVLDRDLGLAFGSAANRLLDKAGIVATEVTAIGSHGQTIRHRPPDENRSTDKAYSCQIGDPNTIAELTGITTVADFRRRDIAAGGQGAPLVPRFHEAIFGSSGTNRAIVNIGGMANVSLLQGCRLNSGFDTGPGNVLLDAWIHHIRGQRYDQGGRWAASGRVSSELLKRLLAHPFLRLPPPKSTGREDFNLGWLLHILSQHGADLSPADIQATLLELTASTIGDPLLGTPPNVEEIYICGGGALNTQLMLRLETLLYPCKVLKTDTLGIAASWVEASAFAWLARQCLLGASGNSSASTGAAGARVLGGIYHC